MKPTLCRVPACSRPGLPSPTINQSTAPPPPPPPKGASQRPLLLARGALGASPAASPAPSSPTSSVSASISSALRLCRRGGDSVAMTVSSRSSSNVTPSGGASAPSTIVSPICISPTSWTIDSGIAVGSASTFSSRVICSSTPPSLTPGASSTPVSSSGTTALISSLRFTRSRSTWTVSPRTGWRWASLSTTGVAFCAVDAQVEHGARAGERQAQLARVRVKAHRLAAAAVEHAGNAPAAAQAARRARAGGLAAVDVQLGGCAGHERLQTLAIGVLRLRTAGSRRRRPR